MELRHCLGIAPATAVVALSIGLAACGKQDEGKRGEPAIDDEELGAVAAELVEAHNAVRARATPAPSPPLEPLAWRAELASIAQDWAEGCVFEHSSNGLGENLAFFSGDSTTPTEVVELWASEASVYDYASNDCAPGEQCGHYTQIVWRDTRFVGCGAASCALDGFEGVIWVCNYDPPGNVIGEQPY